MDGLSTIKYKGKDIIYVDYTVNNIGKDKKKSIALLQSATTEYQKHQPKSVLALCNFMDMRFDMDVLRTFQIEGKKTEPYEKKVACLGIKGLTKAGYNFVIGFTKKPFKIFESKEDALEWLVTD